MNEQLIYDLISGKRAILWTSIEDTIEELPAVIKELRDANNREDIEELLCVVVEKLELSCSYLRESGARISVLGEIEEKVARSLPNKQIKLPERDVEPVFTNDSGNSLKSDGTFM